MPDIFPRKRIPPAWLNNIRCIYCGFSPLRIDSIQQDIEAIKCPHCQLAMEMDESGRYIRIVCPPATLKRELPTDWVFARNIPEMLKQNSVSSSNDNFSKIEQEKSSGEGQAISLPTFNIPDDDSFQNGNPHGTSDETLAYRARELLNLGNPPWKVKQILLNSTSYTEEQISQVVSETKSIPEIRKSKKSSILILGAAVLALFCLIIFAILYSIFSPALFKTQRVNQQYYENAATELASVQSEHPPVKIGGVEASKIPPNIGVFNVPTPIIEALDATQAVSMGNASEDIRHQDGQAVCPLSSQQAADLFGGDKESWSIQQGQWLFLNNKGGNIFIPAGMSGSYLVVGQSLEMKPVSGPARISNIYMIIVTCN